MQWFKNHGVTIDLDPSFQVQINNATRVAFLHLMKIPNLGKIELDAEKLVHALVTSRLDYEHVFLCSCLNSAFKHIQSVARVLTRAGVHIFSLLAR